MDDLLSKNIVNCLLLGQTKHHLADLNKLFSYEKKLSLGLAVDKMLGDILKTKRLSRFSCN